MNEDDTYRKLKRPTYSQLNEMWVQQGKSGSPCSVSEFLAKHGWTESELNQELSIQLEEWRLR